jgi:xylan 1,4-beta-xylosidase
MYHDCLPGSIGAGLKWCDFTLSHAARIEALLSSITPLEQINLISPDPRLGDACNDHTAGVPRVGLSHYMWLVEANTGANSACLGGPDNKCSTTFPGPLGMGASFNRTLWYLKGNVIGTELRAYNNIGWHRDSGPGTNNIGLTGYGPNINNPRDPRFGACTCPYLSVLSALCNAVWSCPHHAMQCGAVHTVPCSVELSAPCNAA